MGSQGSWDQQNVYSSPWIEDKYLLFWTMLRFLVRKEEGIYTKLRMYLIHFFIIWIIFPLGLFGQVEFVQIFPDTIDDTNLEYIELRNTDCEDRDIGGYILEDASSKQYIFPSTTSIGSHNTIHIGRQTSKIILNNTNETLYFMDPNRNIIDQFSYAYSTKWVVIVDLTVIDTICIPTENPEEFNSWITNTGISNTWNTDSWNTDSWNTNTWILESKTEQTGSIKSESDIVINNGTGEIMSETGGLMDGSPETGTWEWENIISETGTIQTGSLVYQNSWSSTPDDTATGVIFPEIFTTLQQPTNAIFSWSFFDCTGQNPCRINLTFEPIFSGWLLERDYICEIITPVWSLLTCNPNTQYFLSWGVLTFRLTKKSDPNQSRSITWEIIYRAIDEVSQKSENHPLSENESSGTGNTEFAHSGITFPDIIPIFQNYTNTTLSWDTFTCTTSPCRLNFTLDPIFNGSYIAKDYICKVLYGTGIYDCNPPQLYLIGTGTIEIRLIHKSSQNISTRILQVTQNIPKSIIGDKQFNNSPIVTGIDKNPPVALIEYDGKIKSYHDKIWEYEMNCYSSTCTINLTAEKSYDPEWSEIHFLWYYGLNDIKTTKDPWERKYGIGDHMIWLRVIDTSGNVASIKYHIHVLWPREKEEVTITKKQRSKVSKNVHDGDEKWKTKKKKKLKKMTFFDPPKITLQKSKFKQEDNNTYVCYTLTKSCSLNLSLTGSQKGIVYTWKYDDGEIVVSKNPKSRSFAPGFHKIQIIAWYTSDNPLWIENIEVKVIKISKWKKKKKVKRVQNSWSIQDTESKNIEQNHDLWEQKSQQNTPMTVLAFLWGLMPILILRKVFWIAKRRV